MNNITHIPYRGIFLDSAPDEVKRDQHGRGFYVIRYGRDQYEGDSRILIDKDAFRVLHSYALEAGWVPK